MSVRNRIAMFEQTAVKEGASPEDRGRSPGVSSITSGSDSPRPLSKVRTSFVAIEKDGRIGLQRNPSESSSISARKLSGNPEAASTILQETTRTNVSSPESIRPNLARNAPSSSALSNSSLQDAGPSIAGQLAASSRAAGELTAPSKPVSPGPSLAKPDPAAHSGPGRPTGPEKGLAESPQITQAPKITHGQGARGGRPSQIAKEGQSQAALDKDQEKAGAGGKASLDQGSENSRPGAARAQSTGVGVPKPVNGADKAKASTPAPANEKPSTPSSQPKPAGKPTQVPSKRSKTPPVDKKPAAQKKSTTTPSSVSPGGFVKPRPKSPTRPVKLPPSLTTHTAASGSKTKNGTSPEQPITKPRSTSRSSLPGKSVARSSSVAGRQRPSIGPPPKQVAKDHPVPKKEAKVDEGFLARMMRPTQASANKVADKVPPTTPPRKTPTLSRKPSSAKMSATRKPASKATSTTTSSVGSPEPAKASTPAAKVEKTTHADEAIKIAKEAEGAVSPKIPKTPELVIVEEEEEPEEASAETTKNAPQTSSKMDDALRAIGKKEDAAPKGTFQEPEVEKADAPVANGNHISAGDAKSEPKAAETPKVQELKDEETW